MKTIDDIEKLVQAYAKQYPESQAVFDRAEYEKALSKYGPDVTAKMINQLYDQLIEEFGKCAAIYNAHKTATACVRHPQGGCVCNQK